MKNRIGQRWGKGSHKVTIVQTYGRCDQRNNIKMFHTLQYDYDNTKKCISEQELLKKWEQIKENNNES